MIALNRGLPYSTDVCVVPLSLRGHRFNTRRAPRAKTYKNALLVQPIS